MLLGQQPVYLMLIHECDLTNLSGRGSPEVRQRRADANVQAVLGANHLQHIAQGWTTLKQEHVAARHRLEA